MSTLLQDVLRTHVLQTDNLATKLGDMGLSDAQEPIPSSSTTTTTVTTTIITTNVDGSHLRTPSPHSDDEELIGVQSIAATPFAVSRTPSRPGSRPHSPTRVGAAARRIPGPLHLSPSKSKASRSDPLRVLPTEVTQRIFGLLTISQLARCARVCKKWNRSQTINYVWFQHYRKEYFHDESLPMGKWTRRESKQNWRITYLDSKRRAAKENQLLGGSRSPYFYSSTPSYTGSGYQTPREIREEKWRAEAEDSRPTKNEMREMYKELNGRKSKAKSKFQTNVSARDKGGWAEGFD
ncbi:hypothetical protein FRB99_001330 [Tulasnella sp. 403]|nr:hypothetical protein FRB99_001330 [Tulasnella sp. 403]